VSRSHPLWQLFLMRMRALWREPSALFWVFVFPLLLSIALGLAFRNQGAAQLTVAVVESPGAAEVEEALRSTAGLRPERMELAAARRALSGGKVALVVMPGPAPGLLVDPGVPEGRTARLLALDALQRSAGRRDALVVAEEQVSTRGARYIDFLIPGLLGFGLMSSSVWGVGWSLVQMRMGKLLKRLVATPMRRSHLLLSFLLSRLLLAAAETAFFVVFARLLFDVRVAGSLVDYGLLSLAGALCFGGLGLLVATRADNAETANGLMNLATLPMIVVSGVFFAASNFPPWMQPIIQALPLTALNDALRAVAIDGAGLAGQTGRLLLLAGWGAVSFVLALRLFRWT